MRNTDNVQHLNYFQALEVLERFSVFLTTVPGYVGPKLIMSNSPRLTPTEPDISKRLLFCSKEVCQLYASVESRLKRKSVHPVWNAAKEVTPDEAEFRRRRTSALGSLQSPRKNNDKASLVRC